MTDFPDVKLKVIPQFPTTVHGGAGIDIERNAGSYTFDLDYSELAPVSSTVPHSATTHVALWESGGDSYSRISIVDLGEEIASSTVATVVTPEQFGAIGDGVADDTAAFIAAVGAAGSDGTVITLGLNKTYKITSTIDITKHSIYFQGAGGSVSTIVFAPTADDVLFNWGNGANSINYGGLRDLTIYSYDSTHFKMAIVLRDQREFLIENVRIAGNVLAGGTRMWSGGIGSVGIVYQGREALICNHLTIAADRPIVLQANPNSFLSIDISQFNKLQLIANGRPCIEAEAGVTATRVTFQDLWMGLGSHGFYSNGSTTALAWQEIVFNNVGIEQGTDPTAYAFYFASTSHQYQGLTFNNVIMDGSHRKGFYFRQVNGALITNMIMGDVLESYNIDSTCNSIAFINSNAAGNTPTIGANVFASSTIASATNLTPKQVIYSNSSADKFGVNIAAPLTTMHLGNATVAAGSEATNHGVVQIDSGSTDATTNGLEWKSGTTGSGFGHRAATIYDGASNIDWVLQARQNAAAWSNRFTIKGASTYNFVLPPGPVAYVLAASGAAASITGTLTETTLAAVTVPANAMGTNGSVRITTVWSYTNSANNKIVRHTFGGTGYNTFTLTTTASGRIVTEICNRNATNSQVGFASGVGPGTAGAGLGFTSGANVTSAVNTTAAVTILITAQLANTGETITLESYRVELFPT